MMKYFYMFMTFVILVSTSYNIPAINVFSDSWNTFSTALIYISAFCSLFGICLVLVVYADEHDNPKSDAGQFFLRTVFGQKFLPKWPVFIWLVLSCVLVQLDLPMLAVAVLLMSTFAACVVYVQNGFYTEFLKQESKR